ncbi:MAG: type II and III secretion system protein, partial [Planctomycetota bacterium]
QQGLISVGQRVPLIQSSNINQFGQQINNFNYENVGIELDVTPRISPDDTVVMQIRAQRSAVGDESDGIPIFVTPEGGVVRTPPIDQTLAQTTVSAASGQTVVLSGLLTKNSFDVHRRVPILADIPLLGDLFRFDSVSQQRTELLIIMTPRVVRSQEDAEMIKQIESARMSWVMCDVVNLHGPSGLRGRDDEWTGSECEEVYPTLVPPAEHLQSPQTMPMPFDHAQDSRKGPDAFPTQRAEWHPAHAGGPAEVAPAAYQAPNPPPVRRLPAVGR